MRTKEIQVMIKEGLFKSGSAYSRAMMEKLTKRARPSATFPRKTIKMQMAANLRLVDFQTHVNKVLHDKGLHIRSKDYCSEFVVLPRSKTAPVVDMYLNRAKNALESGTSLSAGRAKRK